MPQSSFTGRDWQSDVEAARVFNPGYLGNLQCPSWDSIGIHLYLLGALEHFLSFHILGIEIRTDFFFQRLKHVESTNQVSTPHCLCHWWVIELQIVEQCIPDALVEQLLRILLDSFVRQRGRGECVQALGPYVCVIADYSQHAPDVCSNMHVMHALARRRAIHSSSSSGGMCRAPLCQGEVALCRSPMCAGCRAEHASITFEDGHGSCIQV